MQTGKDALITTAERGRWGGSATLSNDIGLGTFVLNEYSDDNYFAQSLRLAPTYGLWDKVTAQADGTLTWEYTAPNSPTNTSGRHVTPSDLRLGITHRSLYRDERLTGVNVSGSFRASLPTSPVSRGRGRIAILSGTAGLDRTFIERLTLAYALGVVGYLNSRITPKSTESDEDIRCYRNPETCPGVGINHNMAFVNTLASSYGFTDRLSASISLSFITYLKYKVGDASEDVNNEGMDNRHTQTWTSGDISANYSLGKYRSIHYSLAAGVASEQLMADSRGTPRFPFFDFETARDNYTLFYLSGTAAY